MRVRVTVLQVLYLRGFVGAQEEAVKWWVPNAFIGTKDWLLLYEEEWGSEYIPLRKTAAIVGSILIPVAYYSARGVGCGKVASFLAAWMVGLEALVLVQVHAPP